MRAEVLIAAGSGGVVAPVLQLKEPLSFWGGVDPATGRLIDPRSPERGQVLTGRVAVIHELRGSSSGSAVLLELIYRQIAPAAIILETPDAILAVAAIIGREMGWAAPPVLRLDREGMSRLVDGLSITVGGDGTITTPDRAE